MRIFSAGIVLIVAMVGFSACKLGCLERVDKTLRNGWQGSFDVRIERTPEACALFAAVSGANYLISSRRGTSGEWKKIAIVHHDDPLEIPKDSIVVKNENIAYASLFRLFVVTVDGGKSWKTFDIDKRLPGMEPSQGQYRNWVVIKNIDIADTGLGKMYLERSRYDNGAATVLSTTTFGQDWSTEK